MSTPSRDTIALAGWLFADLLLGLGLLFFVAESKGIPPPPTPTITPTPSRTYTITPSVTRYPTNTRYPTFTPIYTYTPYPTFTPYPPNLTYTPYPTFTDVPPEWTYTPYPTYTPFPPVATYTPPPPAATYTPYPTILFGLNGTPYTAEFVVSPSITSQLLSSQDVRARAREQFRAELVPQVRKCFDPFNGVARAGVALILGTNPTPAIGNAMAEEADAVLREQFPQMFEGTVTKAFHFLSGDPAQQGHISAEIYFISNSGSPDPFTPDNATCNP